MARPTTMVDPIDDIAKQARQGSMAAIIQILNEQLAEIGVRTRAVIANGALQLLCEAATPEQLEHSTLVPRIQTILEEIAPRKIRRVNILSRIVREQQLLWFDEVSRDPQSQLLWSEKIILKKPNLLQLLGRSQQKKDSQPSIGRKRTLPKVPVGSRPNKQKQSFWKGWAGGVSVSIILLVGGAIAYEKLQPTENTSPEMPPSPVAPSPTVTSDPQADPFAQAVRLAEQAVVGGQSAKTPAEWLELATKWEQASDLMKAVPPDDPRYSTARDRVEAYRRNSQAAQAQADARR